MSVLAGFFEGDFFDRHNVAYAFLDTWPEYIKQYVAGTINQRLPGIFWLNWMAHRYVDAIGEDVLLGLPWFKTARFSGGLVGWLHERVDDIPADLAERVVQFETVLGSEKFATSRWENLPQLALSSE